MNMMMMMMMMKNFIVFVFYSDIYGWCIWIILANLKSYFILDGDGLSLIIL